MIKLRFNVYYLIDNTPNPLYSLSERQIAKWALIKRCKWGRVLVMKNVKPKSE